MMSNRYRMQQPILGEKDHANLCTGILSPIESLRSSTNGERRSASVFFPRSESMLAAMKAQRALRQMALFLEDEEHHESSSGPSSSSMNTRTTTAALPTIDNYATVSIEQYNAFKTRIKELETIVEEQASKLMNIDEIIHEQVKIRSKGQIEKLEHELKSFHEKVEEDIERRVAQRLEKQWRKVQRSASTPSKDIATKWKKLKGFFSEDEISSSKSQVLLRPKTAATASAEKTQNASKEELVELVRILNAHIQLQDAQLAQAQKMIGDALQERNEATEAAHEAFNLSVELDDRLQGILREARYLSFETRYHGDDRISLGDSDRLSWSPKVSVPDKSRLSSFSTAPRARQSA